MCPNHHSIIHDTNPVFDRRRLLYIYKNGFEQKLVLNSIYRLDEEVISKWIWYSNWIDSSFVTLEEAGRSWILIIKDKIKRKEIDINNWVQMIL